MERWRRRWGWEEKAKQQYGERVWVVCGVRLAMREVTGMVVAR